MDHHETLQDPSKRYWLKTSAAVTGALGAGLVFGEQSLSTNVNSTAAAHEACTLLSPDKYDCYGIHQAGIITPQQHFSIMCAFDVSAKDGRELESLLRILTSRIEFLTQGGKLVDPDPKLPPAGSGLLGQTVIPDGLTITVGVGHTLFDKRFGLERFKPVHLGEMKRFPNDRLSKDWTDGDISIQICAFSPETCQNALRDLIKQTTRFAVVRWVIEGWLPKSPPGSAPRNLLGFHDGTANPNVLDPATADEVVWTGLAANSLNEPAWTKNGSYQAVRLIRHFVEFWDRTPLQEQQSIFGREKYTGAPLGKKHEHDSIDYTKGPDNENIAPDSHIRRANERTEESFRKHRIFRRPYNYSRGLSKAGQLDVGLVLIMYQANLEDGFIFIQNMLNGEPLEEYIKPFGGGYFFALPGVSRGRFLGDNLLALVR